MSKIKNDGLTRSGTRLTKPRPPRVMVHVQVSSPAPTCVTSWWHIIAETKKTLSPPRVQHCGGEWPR